jgi:hypothetical protein
MRGENALGVSAKIHVTLFFVELPPQPLGGVDDGPGTSPTKAPLVARELPSPILFDPQWFAQECDARPLYRTEAAQTLRRSNTLFKFKQTKSPITS